MSRADVLEQTHMDYIHLNARLLGDGAYFEGGQLVEEVTGEKMGKVNPDELIRREFGSSPKYISPPNTVINDMQDYEALINAPKDDAIERMSVIRRVREGRSGMFNSRNAQWNALYQSRTTGRDYYVRVEASHDLEDPSITWSLREIWQNTPRPKKISAINRKRLSEQAAYHGFKSVEEYLADTERKEQDANLMLTLTANGIYSDKNLQIKYRNLQEEWNIQLRHLHCEAEIIFKERLTEIYEASTRIPDGFLEDGSMADGVGSDGTGDDKACAKSTKGEDKQ